MISVPMIVLIITSASSVTTAIFLGAYFLGKMRQEIETHSDRLDEQDTRMDKAGQRMSDLADEVQKMPDRFIERREALMWNGSRSGDIKP